MNGIASLLDDPNTARVETIWRELEEKFGLTGVKITPFPHVTWQVVEDYDLPQLETSLRAVVRQAQPLTVHSVGLGLFTGPSPIVYIGLVKDEPLLQFHAMLWEQTKNIAIKPSPFYLPDAWVPHITLAYGDVNRENLNGIMQYLAFQSYTWEIRLDNLIFVAQSAADSYENGCCYRFGQ